MNPDIEFGDAAVYKVDSQYISIVMRYKVEPVWTYWEGGPKNKRDISRLDLLLATSRDGKKWSILGDVEKPWVENGPPEID